MHRQAGSHWKVLSTGLMQLDLTFYKEKQAKNREQEDKAARKPGGRLQGHGGELGGDGGSVDQVGGTGDPEKWWDSGRTVRQS